MNFSDWTEVELKDISIDGKGSYGIGASAVEYSEDLYTYLRITDINDDGTLKKDGLKSVNDSDAEKYLLKPNDIVFARTGNSTGRSYFYDGKDGELVYAGFLIKFSLNSQKVNPRYMRYYTLSDEYNHWVNSFSTGSTRGNINAKTYGSMKINLPPREQQDFLVNILSSLDEKIELNNQMNKTLEKMAQALFKRWFVDFEFPNEDGEPYKSSGGEMVDSELGMLPKGWEIKSLDEIADFLNGLAMQKFRPDEGEDSLPVLKIKELKQGKTDSSSDRCSKNIQDKYIINDGDVIFSWSGSLAVGIWCGGIAGLNQHLFKVTSTAYPKWFYYMWLNEHLERFIRIAADKATTMGHIKRQHLSESKVLVPCKSLLEKMHSQFECLINKGIELKIETVTLENTRNTLLPKLMSGEIRVEE